jgi:hypothetical protein
MGVQMQEQGVVESRKPLYFMPWCLNLSLDRAPEVCYCMSFCLYLANDDMGNGIRSSIWHLLECVCIGYMHSPRMKSRKQDLCADLIS